LLPLHWDWVEGGLVITATRSQAAGLAVGDTVLKIDGRPAADALAEREALISGATSQWIRYSALQELLRGAPGITANLEVAPAREPGKTLFVAIRYEASSTPEEQRPQKS
jgi:hypothetical protein